MKITAIADVHGHEPKIPACDLLLIGGDILMGGDGAPDQRGILNNVTGPWLVEQMMMGVKEVVAVAGNHDFIFQESPEDVPPFPWTYLEDSCAEVQGLKIWGSPWQLPFFDWAYNMEESELEKKWAMIPSDVDILLTHSPPFGYCDSTRQGRCGSKSLRVRVDQIKPKLHVFGHIHVGYGVHRVGETYYANAALVDSRYQLKNSPLNFDWDGRRLRLIEC